MGLCPIRRLLGIVPGLCSYGRFGEEGLGQRTNYGYLHVAKFHASGYARFQVYCGVGVDGCDGQVFDEYLPHGYCEHPDEFGNRVHQYPDADRYVHALSVSLINTRKKAPDKSKS